MLHDSALSPLRLGREQVGEGVEILSDCLFCKIAAKEIPAEIVYEDEEFFAFKDINPQAPVHLLVIPKEHIASLAEATPTQVALLGKLAWRVKLLAEEQGLAEDGYRVVVNCRDQGGQTVPHLHFHLLGGRFMTWPPG